jgi:cytochrome c5
MTNTSRVKLGAIALLAGIALACSQASAPGTGSGETAPAQKGAAEQSGRQTPAASQAASTPAPATVADIFPPGAGRDLVLNNCGTCHNTACSAIGQRTNARWDSLKESHVEKVSGADLNVMFEYLKANFNDSKPEPNVPPSFLKGGCTPF